MRHILNVSMPRSGHNLLTRQLAAYYGALYHYCEYYKPTNCCKQIPCTQIDGTLNERHIFLQKNHDFKLNFPILKNYKYIIQYRHPVPRVISHFELRVKRNPHLDTKEGFIDFLNKSIDHYIEFYKKWAFRKDLNCIIVKYEDLSEKNLQEFKKIINFVENKEIDMTNYSYAAEELKYRNRNQKYQRKRNIFDFRYFDLELIKFFEEQIFSQCSNLEYESCLNKIEKTRHRLTASRVKLSKIKKELWCLS